MYHDRQDFRQTFEHAPYRTATASERDARAERRQRRASAAAADSQRPPTDGDDRRQPFDWTFSCSDVFWSLHFEPSPRDVRQ